MLAPFIAGSMTAYRDTELRSEMTARARLALERLAREVRVAIPNTVRELNGGQGVEFVSSKTGGRYMSRNDNFSPAIYSNTSRFQRNAFISSLYALGTAYNDFVNTDYLVIYNTSPDTLTASSVQLTGVQDLDLDLDGTAEVQQLSFGAYSWGVEPATQHFQIADYSHEVGLLNNNALYWRRVAGIDGSYDGNPDYSVNDPILISSGTLAADFDYIPVSLTSNAMLKVTLTMTENGESVTVSQEIHVRNSP